MGSGCLSPKPRLGQIYIQSIKNIHQEALKANAQNSILYDIVKQKIGKSGHLRKLSDYLISHRLTITEAMSYNSQLANQSKSINSKYAALIIADQIIKIVCQKQIEAKKQSIKSSVNSNQYLVNSNSINKTKNKNNLTESSQKDKQIPFTIKNSNNQSTSFVGQKNRIQQIYFNFILSLFKISDNNLYLKILKSLQKYSNYHLQDNSSYTIKNTQFQISQKVQNILEIILKYISSESFKDQSIKIYSKLIKSVKWYSNCHKDSHNLRYFIRCWIIQMEQDSLLANESSEIIQKYIQFYISIQRSSAVYEAIIQLYDEFQFGDIKFFESFLLELLSRNDLKDQFLRGLFLYLLGYVSWCKNSNLQTRWNVTYPSIINQVTRNNFPNIYNIKTKMNAIKTIRKWLDYKFVQINQTLTYSYMMLIQAYLFNICQQLQKKSIGYSKQIIAQFKLICPQDKNSFLQMNSRLRIIQTFLQQINWIHAEQSYQTLLIDETYKYIKSIDTLQPILQQVIHPITTNISPSNKIKIIKLNSHILKKIQPYSMSNQLLNQHIDTFLFSVYQNLTIDNIQMKIKFQIIDHTLQFIIILLEKKQKNIVYAYWQHITKNITNSQLSFKTSIHLKSLIQGTQNSIPNQMFKINQKLKSNSQISPELQSNLKKMIDRIIQDMKVHPQDIKVQIIDKQNYLHNKNSLNLLFNPKNNNQKQKQMAQLKYIQQNNKQQSTSKSLIKRRTSFISNDPNDYMNDQQQSFRQIMEIINR